MKRGFKFFRKLACIMLVFLFIFTSPGIVLAAESTSSDDNFEDTQEAKSSEEIELIDNGQIMGLESEEEFEYKQDNATEVKLNINRDPLTGSFIYEYPLTVPPGRNGLEPNLKLVYNSQNMEHINIFGYGWDINIPYIERINRKGVEKLYSEDYYSSSLSGELKKITATSTTDYGAKIDNGEFLKYEFIDSTYWQVTDKTGTVYKFGYATSTRQNNPEAPTSTFKWMLEEIRDTNDNYIKYEYYKDDGQIYPDKIKYTGYDTTDGILEIEFLREARDDKATSTNTGFPVLTNYRINEIKTEVSDSWVRKYELDYTTGDNDRRSMLYTITETGQDENEDTVSLPVTEFTYQTKTVDWTHDGNWSIPVNFRGGTGNDVGTRLANVDGDGLIDIVIGGYDVDPVHKVYINKGDGTGWAYNSNYSFSIDFHNNGVFLADVDGDGLDDIIYSRGGETRKVYTNDGDGTGWTHDASFSIPVDFCYSNGYDAGARLADLNGDGLIDIFYTGYDDGDVFRIYLNKGDGTGWSQNDDWEIPVSLRNNEGRIADVNGDGLPDLLHTPYAGTKKVYINKGDGTGWKYDSGYGIPVYFRGFSASDDMGARLVEVNGDGLIDIIQKNSSNEAVYINRGNGAGWAEYSSWDIPQRIDNNEVRLADVDGDGLTDFLYKPYNGTSEVYINNDYKADLISKIEYNSGAEVSLTYKGSPEYSDDSNNSLNPNFPLIFQTLYQKTIDDGLGNSYTTTYKYFGGDYYYNNELDRRPAGFQKIKETDDELGYYTINYHHQGNTSSSTIGEYSDDQSKIGKAYRSEVYDENDNLYAKTINKWENVDLGNNRDFVKLTKRTGFSYDGDADHKEKANTYTYDDIYGNLTQETNYGEVTGSDDGSFTDTGTDLASTTISYAASSTPYIVGLPERNMTEDQNGNKVKENKYYYDNLSLGDVNTGNLTKQEMWESGTDYIDIEKTYNQYGLVTQDKDPRDKTINYVYDSYNFYIATATNPLSQNIGYLYDYSSGKVRQATDLNGNIWQTVYDGLDRPIEEKQPDINVPSTLVVKTDYTYDDSSSPRSIKQRSYLSTSTSSGGASEWYSESWFYREKITVDYTKVDASLTDFPVYLDLSQLGNDFFENVKTDGEDIRITKSDGETELAREVVSCDKINKKGEVHFKADNISSTANTDFYIYYGNSGASDYAVSDTYGRNNVWTNYRFVSHDGGITDSSGNLSPSNSGVTEDTGTAKIGSSGKYERSNNDKITIDTDTNVFGSNPTYLDFSSWVYMATDVNDRHCFIGSYGGTNTTYPLNVFYDDRTSVDKYKVEHRSSNDTTEYNEGIGSSQHGEWIYLAVAFDKNGTSTLYRNGSYLDALASVSAGDYTDGDNVRLGVFDGSNNYLLNGYLDEVKIANNEEWADTLISTEYNNQNSPGTFYSIGSQEERNASDNVSFDAWTYIDGFDRPVQTRKEAEGQDTYSVKDFTYNSFGLLEKESFPYFASSSANTSATEEDYLYTTYFYDALKRTETAVNTVGTTASSYDDWETTITDAKGNTKDLYNDAYGNLIKINEYNSTSTYTTEYEYDLLSNLTKIEDSLENIRNFTYDGLGRLTKSEDLHDSSDSYFASTTYTYDDSGNLTSKTDDEGQIINYTHDDINRVLIEDYTGQAGTEIQYSYDGCTNGIGKLCSATTSDIVANYIYNSFGLIDKETKTIGGTDYETEYDYDFQTNITYITYPDSSRVKYEYNGAGLLDSVSQKEGSEASSSYLLEDIDYNSLGQVAFENFANDTKSFYAYNPEELYRLTSKKTTGSLPAQQRGGGGGGEGMFAPMVAEKLVSEGQAFKKDDGSTMLYEPEELIDKRTENSKTYLVGYTKEGKRIKKTRFHASDIYHYDYNKDEYRRPETKLNENILFWLAEYAGNLAKLNKNIGNNFIELKNGDQKIYFSLLGSGGENKSVYKDLFEEKIVYKNALGKDIDLTAKLNENIFTKEAVIKNKEALGDLEGKEYYETLFKIDSDEAIDLKIGERILSKENVIVSNETAEITTRSGTSTNFYILPPKAQEIVSSSTIKDSNTISIDIKYELDGDSIIMTKLLPIEWLEKANYPIKTDATIQYYSGSGDGNVNRSGDDSWTLCRNSGTGTGNDYTGIYMSAFTTNNVSESKYGVGRVFLPFDTSSLEDDAVVSSTKIYVYVENRTNNCNDGYDYITVVQSSQASVSSLNNDDYDEVGEIEGIDSGDRKDITSIGTGWKYFNLNATGTSWIDNDGYTKLALIEGHDFADELPCHLNQVSFRSSDNSGTTYDPYLDITYTNVQDSPLKPTYLKVEDQLSPASSVDTTPEFSAIYNDPDTGDIAEYYRIQVSTSSSDWTDTVWDSGKTVLTSSTTEGSRCEDISYAGSSLSYDTVYYWRIKFWDDEDLEGEWSLEKNVFVVTDKDYLQNFNYSYDKIGNISKIVDSSETNSAKNINFIYDDLYRLTHASASSTANNSNYTRIYSYNSIGNITSIASGTINLNWYDPNWGYRKKITIDYTKVDDDLSNFPVYLDLSLMGNDFFNKINNDGGDIRLTNSDGQTELAREIVSASTTSKEGELYFKADSISSTADTYFYVYYSNASSSDYNVTDTYGRNNVWTNYEFVSHDGGITDSSGNLSPSNSGVTIDTGTAKIGSSGKYERSSNDQITIDTDTNVFGSNPTYLDFSSWVYMATDVNDRHTFIGSYGGTNTTYPLNVYYDDRTSVDKYRVGHRSSSNTTEYNEGVGSSQDGEWIHLSVAFDKNGTSTLYRNGSYLDALASASSGDYTDGDNVRLGVFDGSNNYLLNGYLDEVKIANNEEWASTLISTEYNNQNSPSTFLSIGSEEDYEIWTEDMITSSSTEESVYSYTGDQGTNFANPHAVTQIGSSTHTYDNNGNMTSETACTIGHATSSESTCVYSWDWRDRLTGVTDGTTTVRYDYDYENNRIWAYDGTSTTTYVNKFYSTDGATSTKHIFANNQLIATIEADGNSTSTYYTHTDHLGGSSVMTNESGEMVQLLDYYPFGDIRLNEKAGSFDEKRKFTGHEHDDETDLEYMKARYYNGNIGKFLSIDPAYLSIGNNQLLKQKTGLNLHEYLSDPQLLNSYGYARNNPVRYNDPTGNLSWDALLSNPISSLKRAVSWGVASLGLNVTNRPFSASLIRHSASLNPGDININPGNQKQYGSPIDKIMGTSQYKNYVSQTIEKAKNGEMSNSGHFKFENKSDLYYSLYRAKVESQVTKENGEWVVRNTVTDRYDFNPTNPKTYKGTATRIPATQAYKDQQSGVLSNYDVKINFSDKIKE